MRCSGTWENPLILAAVFRSEFSQRRFVSRPPSTPSTMYRSVLRQVSLRVPSPLFLHQLNLSQSSSPSRFLLSSARFASTSSKQSTLKERLAILIPQEIEKVCSDILRLLSLTPF